MEIARLREGDEERLRDIRLRALAEAPSAFASTYGRERRFTADVWASRVAGEGATFIAEDDGRPVGTVAVIPEDRPRTAHLVGMWVDPRARGQGIARRLIDAVVTWACERGMRHLELWVAENNDGALALYEKTGFSLTGERQPLPSDPAVTEFKLARELQADPRRPA